MGAYAVCTECDFLRVRGEKAREVPLPERCPSCGRMALIPWTLRRDNDTKVVFRTWVCTECQTLVERPEPE